MFDAAEAAWLDQEDAMVTTAIRRYGWFIQYVFGADGYCEEHAPPEPSSFAYTVGLFGLGHPELLIYSVPQQTTAWILNDLGSRIRAGADFIPGQLIGFDGWAHKVVCEAVPNPGEIAFSANRHYCRPAEESVPVLQLTYNDIGGRFPWDAEYEIPLHVQPRPGMFRA